MIESLIDTSTPITHDTEYLKSYAQFIFSISGNQGILRLPLEAKKTKFKSGINSSNKTVGNKLHNNIINTRVNNRFNFLGGVDKGIISLIKKAAIATEEDLVNPNDKRLLKHYISDLAFINTHRAAIEDADEKIEVLNTKINNINKKIEDLSNIPILARKCLTVFANNSPASNALLRFTEEAYGMQPMQRYYIPPKIYYRNTFGYDEVEQEIPDFTSVEMFPSL